MEYADFFQRATGHRPYPYQQALAEGERLAGVLEVPTGLGKTAAAVLAWLWRRQQSGNAEPRRLIFCLPMRALVDQCHDAIAGWLTQLGDALPGGPPRLYKLMGGEDGDGWDRRPEDAAILVGTQDLLLSHALNRGYGSSRFRWPLRFGLLNNDVLWVIDEVQLMGAGLPTTTQLQALRRALGTLGPARTLWMSATLQRDWLQTVDVNDEDLLPSLTISDADRAGAALLLQAPKALERSPVPLDDPQAVAEAILASHKHGSLTLVVLNTVSRAAAAYAALKKIGEHGPELLLVHSRFRAQDRQEKLGRLLAPPRGEGMIAVCTQVVEAGVDLSSATLWTEPAPWPSLVQRFGRCNRRGERDDASVFVLAMPQDADDKKLKSLSLPYAWEDLADGLAGLEDLDDVGLCSLPRRAMSRPPSVVLRRRDLVDLFDATGDLMGYDTDISRFVRDTHDRSVRVFWRDVAKEGPAEDEPPPHRDELCAVPIGDLRTYLSKKSAWRWQARDGTWERIRGKLDAGSLFPGMTLLLSMSLGGYSAEVGWDLKSKDAVVPVEIGGAESDVSHDSEPYSANRGWVTLVQHLAAVEAETGRICDAILPALPWRTPLMTAARWHDVGKAHPVFQRSLRGGDSLAPGAPGPEVLLAKSSLGRIRHERRGFRHELASALRGMEAGLPDLIVYLVAAHHGKVRLSIRSLPDEPRADHPSKRFARGIWDGDELPEIKLPDGAVLPPCALRLNYMELGDDPETGPSWLSRTLSLRDDPELGPLRLSLMEAILKAADERASGAPR